MVLRSFECTQILLWIFCLKPQCLSGRASGTSKRKRVLCFRLGNWSERGLLDSDVRRRKQPTVEQHRRWPRRAIPRENPQLQKTMGQDQHPPAQPIVMGENRRTRKTMEVYRLHHPVVVREQQPTLLTTAPDKNPRYPATVRENQNF